MITHETKRQTDSAVSCADRSLRTSSCFDGLLDREAKLLQALKIRDAFAEAGSRLIQEGDTQRRLYTLFSGWAIQYKALSSGRLQIVDIFLPGDLIGLTGVLRGSAPFQVRALTDISYCVLNGARLREFVEERPGVGWQVAEIAGTEALRAKRMVCRIVPGSADERVAEIVLDLHARLSARKMTRGNCFDFPMTQQHLGDLLGQTIVHMNRVLRRFHEHRICTIRYGQVIIHDFEALAALACVGSDDVMAAPLLRQETRESSGPTLTPMPFK